MKEMFFSEKVALCVQIRYIPIIIRVASNFLAIIKSRIDLTLVPYTVIWVEMFVCQQIFGPNTTKLKKHGEKTDFCPLFT